MFSSNEITTVLGEWPPEIVNCYQTIKIHYVPIKSTKTFKKSLLKCHGEAQADLFLPVVFRQDV